MAKTKIPGEYLVDGGITVAKMAANSVDSDQYVDGSIDLIHMSVNSIDSDQYVDGSIDTIHIADGAITSAKLDTNIAVGGTLNVSGAFTSLGINTMLLMQWVLVLLHL
jgi:trimeric autotransporter adhesin